MTSNEHNNGNNNLSAPKLPTVVFMENSNTQSDSNIENPKSIQFFFNKTRFLILVLSLACLTVAQANTLGLNFTVICMSDLVVEQNFSDSGKQNIIFFKFTNIRLKIVYQTHLDSVHWLEDSSKISLLFSAVAIGSIIGTFPIMWSISKFGVR